MNKLQSHTHAAAKLMHLFPAPLSIMSCNKVLALSLFNAASLHDAAMSGLRTSCDAAIRVSYWQTLHSQGWLQTHNTSRRNAAVQNSSLGPASGSCIGRDLCAPWPGSRLASNRAGLCEVRASLQLSLSTKVAAMVCHHHDMWLHGDA